MAFKRVNRETSLHCASQQDASDSFAPTITDVDEYNKFIEDLESFHKDLGTTLAPVWSNGKRVNMHLLYKIVTEHGGFDKVTGDRQWKRLSENTEFKQLPSSASYIMKKSYDQYLFDYEQARFFGREVTRPEPQPAVESDNDDEFDAMGNRRRRSSRIKKHGPKRPMKEYDSDDDEDERLDRDSDDERRVRRVSGPMIQGLGIGAMRPMGPAGMPMHPMQHHPQARFSHGLTQQHPQHLHMQQRPMPPQMGGYHPQGAQRSMPAHLDPSRPQMPTPASSTMSLPPLNPGMQGPSVLTSSHIYDQMMPTLGGQGGAASGRAAAAMPMNLPGVGGMAGLPVNSGLTVPKMSNMAAPGGMGLPLGMSANGMNMSMPLSMSTLAAHNKGLPPLNSGAPGMNAINNMGAMHLGGVGLGGMGAQGNDMFGFLNGSAGVTMGNNGNNNMASAVTAALPMSTTLGGPATTMGGNNFPNHSFPVNGGSATSLNGAMHPRGPSPNESISSGGVLSNLSSGGLAAAAAAAVGVTPPPPTSALESGAPSSTLSAIPSSTSSPTLGMPPSMSSQGSKVHLERQIAEKSRQIQIYMDELKTLEDLHKTAAS